MRNRLSQRSLNCFIHSWWGSAALFALLIIWFLAPILAPPQGQSAGGADIRGLFIPWLETARQALRNGQLPLWDAHQFGGYAFYSNPQVALFYPLTWPLLILPLHLALGWHMAVHLWLLALGLLLFLRREGVSLLGAWAGTLSFTFSGFFAARIFAGHMGVIATFAWLPWLLLGLSWLASTRTWWAAVIAAVPLALAILAGHVTSLLYLGLIALFYILYLTIGHRSRRLPALYGLLLLAGLALSCIQLLPFLETAMLSSRAANSSFQTASDYSFPPAHLITLALPEFFGEPTTLGYWSVPLFEEFAYYSGVVTLLGMVLALRKPERRVWLYMGLAILGLWLALGHYTFFYRLVYTFIPLFRLARAPARAAVLFTFAGSVLTALAITRWRQHPDRPALQSTLRWTAGAGALLAVTGLAATGAVFAAQHPTETSGRLWHQLGGWSWFLLVLLPGAALLWQALTANSQPRRNIAGLLLVLLIIVDLWHFGQKLVRPGTMEPAGIWYTAREVIGDGEGRVLPWGMSIFEQNGAGQVGLYSIFGYNVIAPGAAERLTSSVPDPRSSAYDLFSVGYVLAHVPQDNFTSGDGALQLISEQNGAWIYRRPQALPIARLVHRAEIIPEAEQAIDRIHEAGFDPQSTAILARDPDCELSGPAGTQGTVQLQERTSTSWQLAVATPVPALLILSENNHPGWRVFIDGEPATSLTAYTALRAVCVPAGEHVVSWRFQPFALWWGAAVSFLSFALLIVALTQYRKRETGKRTTTMTLPDHA